jgi:autotransporter translocation and assembly factor TamB
VEQAAARIRASGRLQGDSDKQLNARLEARNVDLANLVQGGATTRLNVAASTELTLAESGMNGSYRVVSEDSRFDDQSLPEARIEGNVKAPQGADTTTIGTLTIAEPGAPTTLDYRVLARQDGVLAHATLRSKLEGSARLQALSGLRATGKIDADVDYDGPAERIEANAEVDLQGLDHPSFKARRVTASLYASGLVAAPMLKLASQLKGVSAGGRTFSNVKLAATGTPAQLAVQARLTGKKPEHIDLRAVVAANEQRVDAVEVTLSDPAEPSGPLRLTAQSVHWGKKIRAEGVSLDGPGHARAELVYGQGLESLQLESERLDPLRIARMLGLTKQKGGVELSLSANVKSRGRIPSGKVTGQIANVNFGQLSGARADLDLELLRGKLSGQASFDLGKGGKAELVVKEFKLPTGSADAGALQRVSGELALKGALDLRQFQQLLPFGGVERAEGRITFDIARQEPNEKDERSRWSAHLESERLLLVQERKPVQQPPSATAEQAQRAEPFALRGIDIKLDAELGSPGAKLAGRLKDAKGELVSVDGELEQVHSVSELIRALKAMQTTQFTAKLRVPKRELQQLPATIRPAEVQGTLALEVDAAGTLAAPRVDVRAQLGSFGAKRERARRKRGIDVELSAHYERPGGKLELSADRQERTVLDLKSRWAGDLRDLGKWTPGKPSPVRANLNLALSQFPLGVIPELQNRNIRGTVSGKGTLEQFGKDARVALELTTDQLRIEKLRLDKLQASVEAGNGKLLARTSLDGRGGKASGEISTNVTWGNRVVPVLDPALEGSFKANGLRLSALEPLLTGTVSELDGFADIDLRAQIQNGKPQLSGDVKLRDGVVQLPSIGQRFDKVQAHVAIQPGRMVMDELHALGITGAFDAKAEAQLDGLAPTSANMSLSIKENRKLPLTIEGEAVGDGWGTIEAKFQRNEAEKANKIEIDLKKFYIQLPNAPPGGVQNLAPADNIRIGYRRKDGDFVAVPLQPVKEPPEPSEWKTVVVVDINSLWVEKGDQAKLGLGGKVEATLGETVDVRGKIETRRGKIDISGKLFDIERGTVTFTGEADNPIVNAVARYEAPDGYTVFAEYTGTAAKGSLRLSSEPPLSQDEILTLLLFGSPDGSFGSSESNGIATAVSVAGGTAAQGLNRAMSDLTNLDVQARVDTSTGSPRPELVVQLSARVAARVTQALGEPAPGQSPDRTFLTVELRFASAWSLSTMIGDKGASALDLIWRKRY